MSELGVIPLKADITGPNEVADRWLRKFGKAGVPFYLVFPVDPKAEPVPLPELITPGMVTEALRRAAGS